METTLCTLLSDGGWVGGKGAERTDGRGRLSLSLRGRGTELWQERTGAVAGLL
jgi:hypothetical protein